MTDGRLSTVLHLLLHMALRAGPVTSEALARSVGTNAVVIRRLLAGLRERGVIRSEKGHGGGWTLASDPATVTLRAVYEAIGSPPLLALGHRSSAPGCLVEKAVHASLGRSMAEAEARLLADFGAVTLAALRDDVRASGKARSAVNAEVCDG